jgi:cytochrome c556
MKKVIIIIICAFSLSVFASPATDAVKYRQSAMQLIKANLSDMGAMIKGKKPYNAKVFNKSAKNLKALSSMPWSYFAVDGSNMVDKSKAKDGIWDDEKKFKNGIKYFKKVVAKIDKLATPKASLIDVKSAFVDLEKTCKGCHKNFKNK